MITTHVLDTSRGTAAAGLSVVLTIRQGGGWQLVGRAATDAQGRIARFSTNPLVPGTYRLTFETAAYHRSLDITPFFADVVVTFEIEDDTHYHLPLLLSPYGYSTYRGT